jgi:hypothetical protein
MKCDYSLQGLTEDRCPECGRSFDPDDPKTMRFGRRGERLQRLLLKPVGLPTLALALAATASVLAHTLRAMLTRAGLSGPEADGLVACWRPQFFAAEGRRFLLLMSAADYNALCPLRIRPAPTELARVGLVLTEFHEGIPPRPHLP